jgi:hypothetical protein
MCKPKKEVKKNLILSIDFIEVKYNIRIRDYAAGKLGIKSSTNYNMEHEKNWYKNNNFSIPEKYTVGAKPGLTLNAEGNIWWESGEGRIFYRTRERAYKNDPDGKCKEIPRLDFWHHMVDFIDDLMNDTICTVNYKEILDGCTEDWQKEIGILFVNEFGSKDIRVKVSW